MKWVKGVEDLNIRIVRAQGIVGVGVTTRIFIFSFPAVASRLTAERWIACRPGFFLPVRVLSRLFRRLFLHYLERPSDAGELDFFSAHRQPA